jgi:hypothetical protein
MQLFKHRLSFLALLAGMLVLISPADAKNKKVKAAPKDPQDEIEVVGHIPLTNGPIRRFLATQHYSSHYVYAERDPGKSVTLIDVTKFKQPVVLGEVSYPSNGDAGSLFAVAGTAALVTNDQSAPAVATAPQTVRIMDFSDAQHPRVAREFAGVTAISRDGGRGLILVANPEGILILQRRFAEDPEVDKAYAHQVVYQ